MPLLVDIQMPPHYEPLVDQALLRQAVAATVKHQGWRAEEGAEVVIVIADDDDVRALNIEFRDIDSSTDVLAFPGTLAEDFVTPDQSPSYLGDVVISYTRAEMQAAQAGHPVERELQLLTIHGVLHLMGLDDRDEAGYQRMVRAQEQILESLAALPPSKGGRESEDTARRQ